MLYALAYASARALLGLLVRSGGLSAADVELLALRHEARTLRRAGHRGAWRSADRLLLAALSRCLPTRDWGVFPVHRPRSGAGPANCSAADGGPTAGRDDRRSPPTSRR